MKLTMSRSFCESVLSPCSWLRLRNLNRCCSKSQQFLTFVSNKLTPSSFGGLTLTSKFSSSSMNGPHPFVPEAEKRTRMQGDKLWKDAASLIIAAPDPEDKTKTHFLVMKRSKGSTFAPNTLCFPGGVINLADCDSSWIDWFRGTTGSELPEVDFLQPSARQPPIYGTSGASRFQNSEDVAQLYHKRVPLPVALRIAAIRETFEECGILITRPNVREEVRSFVGSQSTLGQGYLCGSQVIQDPDELEEWQQRVRQDPGEFLALCKKYLIRPDLNALAEWSNWLTPNSFGYKRFDTVFYMAVVPHTLPFLNDEFEVATVRWTSADKVLQGAKDGKAKLIPPQIYELTRLQNTTIQRIQQLMRMRLNLGIERWCPAYIKVTDGIISVFPGDDLYPSDYKIEEFEEIRELDQQSLEQVRASTKKHHRIEFKSEYEFRLVINVSPTLGHIYMN